MNCPVCGSKTTVMGSRIKGKRMNRRRECTECLTRFNTFEGIDVLSIPEHLRNRVYENQI